MNFEVEEVLAKDGRRNTCVPMRLGAKEVYCSRPGGRAPR